MAGQKEFLSIPEAAVLMGISRIAVFKKVKKGQLAAIRVGRNWAVPASALENPAPAAPPAAVQAPPALKTERTPLPRSFDAAENRHKPKISRLIPPSTSKGPDRPRPASQEEPAPQKDSMDDIGWD